MSYFNELVSGSKEYPLLVYTQTTDPITGLALLPAAAWGTLFLYKLLLELIEKHLSIWKSIKALRASGLDSKLADQVEQHVHEITKQEVEGAVSNSIDSVERKVPKERVMEIKIGIAKEARISIDTIAQGARMGITIESLPSLSLITENVNDIELEQIFVEIAAQNALERRIDQALGPPSEPMQRLLPRSRIDKLES